MQKLNFFNKSLVYKNHGNIMIKCKMNNEFETY